MKENELSLTQNIILLINKSFKQNVDLQVMPLPRAE